jgi:integrase
MRGAAIRYPVFQCGPLNQACERLGIPRLTPHELRHTGASLAIASGADVKVGQQMLGHKSAVMTLDQYGDRSAIGSTSWPTQWTRSEALRDVSKVCHEGEVVSLDAARNSG